MTRIAIGTVSLLTAVSAPGAKLKLDDDAKAVVADRNKTRETRMKWWRDANGTAVGFGALSGVVAQNPHLPGQVFVNRRPEFSSCHGIGQSE